MRYALLLNVVHLNVVNQLTYLWYITKMWKKIMKGWGAMTLLP